MGGTEKGEEDTREDLGLQEGDGLKERKKEKQQRKERTRKYRKVTGFGASRKKGFQPSGFWGKNEHGKGGERKKEKRKMVCCRNFIRWADFRHTLRLDYLLPGCLI